jgi:putative membrane protein
MLYLLVNWFLSALCLMIVAHLVSGFEVRSFGAALVASIVIGLINATLGLLLKIVTFPLTIVTFGLFLFVINALMLYLASSIVPGFFVASFGTAFVAAIVLALLHVVLRHIVFA